MYQCFRPDKYIIFRRRIVDTCQKKGDKQMAGHVHKDKGTFVLAFIYKGRIHQR